MTTDGLILASLPSSGSDWFAQALCASDPALIYAREYFCPFVNWEQAERLERTLGDTLLRNSERLTQGITATALSELVEDTWKRSGATFTKENYIPFQVETFAERFRVIILLREFRLTFPPNRRRVLLWYEHFGQALISAGRLDSFCESHAKTPMNRAALGHYWFSRRYMDAARTIGCPVVWFGQLMNMTEQEITDAVAMPGINAEQLARQVVLTRKPIARPEEHMPQWAAAYELHSELEQRYGSEESR